MFLKTMRTVGGILGITLLTQTIYAADDQEPIGVESLNRSQERSEETQLPTIDSFEILYSEVDPDTVFNDDEFPRCSGYFQKAWQWCRNHKKEIIAASVAAVSIVYYLLPTRASTSNGSNAEEDIVTELSIHEMHAAVGFRGLEIPVEYFHTIAENRSISYGNFTHMVTGWLSKCFNPRWYKYQLFTHAYESFQECDRSCTGSLEIVGRSGYDCFNMLTCLGNNATSMVTCIRDVPNWTLTQRGQFEEQWFRDWVNYQLPEWYNRTMSFLNSYEPAYGVMQKFSHPELIFHHFWSGLGHYWSHEWELWRQKVGFIEPDFVKS